MRAVEVAWKTLGPGGAREGCEPECRWGEGSQMVEGGREEMRELGEEMREGGGGVGGPCRQLTASWRRRLRRQCIPSPPPCLQPWPQERQLHRPGP